MHPSHHVVGHLCLKKYDQAVNFLLLDGSSWLMPTASVREVDSVRFTIDRRGLHLGSKL
ncbi:hypothetical protein M406DRAFT_53656 [Cryphonectria parasitica EP155]|uniref:Uncharacterized protein n=1 Tax=Cryphonectria parasitica (strain ATCC 38755 / EP155) TaxID=660469 RepID=A0A9P4YBI0_CRYP1|nr:uncharacterized protein M406DRAFT_53656 [Cryphonectria parasitica EP155]KAF3770003.1 hypothetical protein M406DRAFT_53656 [Cryphonectria parasitica EP155]